MRNLIYLLSKIATALSLSTVLLYSLPGSSVAISGVTEELESSEHHQTLISQVSGLTFVMPERRRNPAIEQAIVEQWTSSSREEQYIYNFMDLNGDSEPEAIVQVIGRYSCGSGGCSTLIFEKSGQSYNLVAQVRVPARPPIIVINQSTNGWRDLIIHSPGAPGSSYPDAKLVQYNNGTYEEAGLLARGQRIRGNQIFGRSYGEYEIEPLDID